MSLMLLALLGALPPTPARDPDAGALIRRALEAMGGESRVRRIGALRIAGMGHEYWLGVAEQNDSGPWSTRYQQVSELRDLTNRRVRRTVSQRWDQAPEWRQLVTVVSQGAGLLEAGGRLLPAGSAAVTEAEESFLLSPEGGLLAALAAADTRRAGSRTHRHVPHDAISFTWRDGRVEVLLNRYTGLPSLVRLRRSYPDHLDRNGFGPTDLTVAFSGWKLLSGGLWYPHKWMTTLNGHLWRDFSVYQVDVDPPAPADSFVVPDTVRVLAGRNPPLATLALNARGAPTEIRPGITGFRDLWNSFMIRQEDGVVIVEAHVSPGYARQLVDEAARRYPGAPITALVLTSDPWTHLGGLATFVERRVPIYVADGSAPFIRDLVRRLAGRSRASGVRPVSGRVVLGRGANRLELLPVRGEYSERMLMAYFPEHRLLYGTDLVWRRPGPSPQYVPTQAAELAAAVARDGLAVDSVFHVHSSTPVAWSEILAALRPR